MLPPAFAGGALDAYFPWLKIGSESKLQGELFLNGFVLGFKQGTNTYH